MGENNIVATCHAKTCIWWNKERCISPNIEVGVKKDHADCQTFKEVGEK